MVKANSSPKKSATGKYTRFDGGDSDREDFEAGSDVGEEFMKVCIFPPHPDCEPTVQFDPIGRTEGRSCKFNQLDETSSKCAHRTGASSNEDEERA